MPDLAWQAPLLALAALLGLLAGMAPPLAVLGATGLAFFGIVMANLTAGLCLFTFVSFVEVLPGNPAISFTKIVGLVLALSWLATIATRDDAKNDFFSAHAFAAYLLLLFLAWTALSTLWAESGSAATTAASRFALNFLLFPIVYTAIRTREHARAVALTFVVGAVFSAIYGFGLTPAGSDIERLQGAVGEANELASVLVAGLVLAAGIAFAARRSPGTRLAALIAAGFCLAGVFLSLSRGGILALGVVLVIGIFVAGRHRSKAAVVAMILAIVGFTYFTVIASPAARERVTTIEGGSGRLDLWAIGWRMAEDKPLTGVGASNFEISSPRYLLQPGAIVRDDFVLDRPKQTHNIYLQMLAELGIPGLLLFLSVIGFSLVSGARAARSFRRAGDVRMEILAWSFFVAAVGLLATDFFQSEQFSKQLWLLLAIGPALLGLARRGEEVRESAPDRHTTAVPASAPAR
jgi:putative inorganic carbon (HCO3(-)) transporter